LSAHRFSTFLRALDLRECAHLLAFYLHTPGASVIIFVSSAFILLHGYIVVAGAGPALQSFRLHNERGIPEYWEFAMLLASSGLLAWRAVQRRLLAYLVPALICLAMAVDGRFQVHEIAGHAWMPGGGGEFFIMAAAGAAFLRALCLAIVRSSSVQRTELTCYALLLFVFGLFGVVADALHALVASYVIRADQPLGWVEDGGELATLSLVLILSLGVFRRLAAAAAERGSGGIAQELRRTPGSRIRATRRAGAPILRPPARFPRPARCE
jgi:hypothetical protein